jgi:hypothetical protein
VKGAPRGEEGPHLPLTVAGQARFVSIAGQLPTCQVTVEREKAGLVDTPTRSAIAPKWARSHCAVRMGWQMGRGSDPRIREAKLSLFEGFTLATREHQTQPAD